LHVCTLQLFKITTLILLVYTINYIYLSVFLGILNKLLIDFRMLLLRVNENIRLLKMNSVC